MAETAMSDLDPWYLQNLICPFDRSSLRLEGAFLVGASGQRYPVVEGVPVMLRDDVEETIDVARSSLNLAVDIARGKTSDSSPLYLKTLGISDEERLIAERLHRLGGQYDPVVAVIVGATSGGAYTKMVGTRLTGGLYPIPKFRFPGIVPGRLLDIGCNWGRWTIAASRAGHAAVGIDPQLGAVLAARRVSEQMGVRARFVVGDARYLPFRDGSFDYAWSYSVLQHFSPDDARASIMEVKRCVRQGGRVRIQMANALGIRSFYQMARRKFRQPTGFDVRYWSPSELETTFKKLIGTTRLDADCYFGLGLQWCDFRYMDFIGKCALIFSEMLRRTSQSISPFRLVADSLFCTARVENNVLVQGVSVRHR